MIDLVPLATQPAAAIEALLDRAFGAGRHGRTAYKVRGTATPIAALSLAAVEAGVPIGSIQCWPVALAGDDGRGYPLVMVGPVAVEPSRQRDGVGQRLVAASLAAAAEGRLDGAMMLIGDSGYYGRFFGFSAERTGGWRLPGPVEQYRVLARGRDVPAIAGKLGPRQLVAA